MKKYLALFVICFALATTSIDAEAARRIGGGASFGRPAPTFSQKAPAAAPAQAPRPQQGATAQQRPNTAAPAPAARPSMMRSMLTGLAAALGISALLSLLGINGAGMVSFVMGLLLVVGAFMLFRMLTGARRAENARGPVRAAPQPQNEEVFHRTAQPETSFQPSRSGSVFDQFSSPDHSAGDGAVDITPADFDRKAFLATARENYRKLQTAWDSGNVIELSEFTTQDVFTAITHQLRERGHEVYKYEILSLENDLLGIARDGSDYLAAVAFKGQIRINGEVEEVNEIWTLEKPVAGNGGWLLSGIKQNDQKTQ